MPALANQEVLLVTYEDMLADLSTVVLRIANFLELHLSPQDISDLLPTFSFTHMKADLNRFQPRSVTWKNGFQFLRKGVAGDSDNVATDIQRRQFREWLGQCSFVLRMESELAKSAPDALASILKVMGL